MRSRRVERLRERLLRAGVAPRHVERLLSELRDHQSDAMRAELAKGADLAAAREAAWARLGTEESLAQGVLERPELRSTAARFPALAFGLGPVLAWLGAPIVVALALSLLPEATRRAAPELVGAFYALCVLHARLLPVLLGALALEMAARRRSKMRWPLAGTALVAVFSGTLTVYVAPGQLGINSSLLPWLAPFSKAFGPREVAALGEGLLRAVVLLALSVIVAQCCRRFGRSGEPTLAE